MLAASGITQLLVSNPHKHITKLVSEAIALAPGAESPGLLRPLESRRLLDKSVVGNL